MSQLYLSPQIRSAMQLALDGVMIDFARPCTLYFPPVMTATTFPLNTAYGGDSAWSQGMPQPAHSMQGLSPYSDSTNTIAVESTGTIQMVIYLNPSQYDSNFPKDVHRPQDVIRTRGYVSDLPSVLNCTRMETYIDVGTDHYKYKLAGRPTIPGKIVPSRFFFAWWESL